MKPKLYKVASESLFCHEIYLGATAVTPGHPLCDYDPDYKFKKIRKFLMNSLVHKDSNGTSKLVWPI